MLIGSRYVETLVFDLFSYDPNEREEYETLRRLLVDSVTNLETDEKDSDPEINVLRDTVIAKRRAQIAYVDMRSLHGIEKSNVTEFLGFLFGEGAFERLGEVAMSVPPKRIAEYDCLIQQPKEQIPPQILLPYYETIESIVRALHPSLPSDKEIIGWSSQGKTHWDQAYKKARLSPSEFEQREEVYWARALLYAVHEVLGHGLHQEASEGLHPVVAFTGQHNNYAVDAHIEGVAVYAEKSVKEALLDGAESFGLTPETVKEAYAERDAYRAHAAADMYRSLAKWENTKGVPNADPAVMRHINAAVGSDRGVWYQRELEIVVKGIADAIGPMMVTELLQSGVSPKNIRRGVWPAQTMAGAMKQLSVDPESFSYRFD